MLKWLELHRICNFRSNRKGNEKSERRKANSIILKKVRKEKNR